MSRSPWLLVLAGLVAAVFVGGASPATRSTASTQFAITQTVLPLFVKENGAKATRKVYWEGKPVFPVTVHEKGICPETVNCGPRDAAGWGRGRDDRLQDEHEPACQPELLFLQRRPHLELRDRTGDLADGREGPSHRPGPELLGLQDALDRR